MPNWVSNEIKFDTDEIFASFKAKYVKDVDEEDNERRQEAFSFARIIPEPATKEECDKKYIIDDKNEPQISKQEEKPWFNWYDWHCDFWGVKWDAYYSSANDRDRHIVFDTAWDLPMPIYKKLAKDGWKFSFTAIGEGDSWGVDGHSEDGQIIIDKSWENSYEDEDIKADCEESQNQKPPASNDSNSGQASGFPDFIPF